ncbi:MAG: tetratricopeptide repeat protein [Candidatus Aminicenantes bacterium]|nr:tetratricopeptide repeat protein [Candidatus Aminicenantes bacterium]
MTDIVLLQTWGLSKNAGSGDVRRKYLELTAQEKFQKVLLDDEHLQKEFTRVHEAYVNLLQQYSEEGLDSDDTYYPPEQVAKFMANSGIYHFLKENYLKAGEKLQQAYKTNQKDVLVLLYLGLFLMKKKSYVPAEKYFLDAANLDPNNEDVMFYLGENYARAGNYKKALYMFKRVAVTNPARKDINRKIKDASKKLGQKGSGGESLLKKISNIFSSPRGQ